MPHFWVVLIRRPDGRLSILDVWNYTSRFGKSETFRWLLAGRHHHIVEFYPTLANLGRIYLFRRLRRLIAEGWVEIAPAVAVSHMAVVPELVISHEFPEFIVIWSFRFGFPNQESDKSNNPESSVSYLGFLDSLSHMEIVQALELLWPTVLNPFLVNRDAVIYALGVGACSGDAVDEKELKYVYHKDGQSSVQVLPTFPATFSLLALSALQKMPGLKRFACSAGVIASKCADGHDLEIS
ncbi:hypothetical protein ACLOJK_002296 [Asimina triloba]